MSVTVSGVERDVSMIAPDAHVIAKNMVDLKPGHIREADLADGITGITLVESIKQLNTLSVTVQDNGWHLLDSGFFDTDANGDMDAIDVNYPDGSPWWWRLTQVSPQGSSNVLTLLFVPRGAEILMHHEGPIKAARSQMTRAQFLAMLAKKAGIAFFSAELTTKQPIAAPIGTVGARRFGSGRVGLLPLVAASGSSDSASGGGPGLATLLGNAVHVGIRSTKGLTVKGIPMTPSQMHYANVILGVPEARRAPDVAAVAMVYAAIWESTLGEEVAWNSSIWHNGGVLAGGEAAFARYGDPSSDAVSQQQAKSFLLGGRGYQNGGAINLSRVDGSAVSIATRVEAGGSYSGEAGYVSDAWATAEAQKIVTAYGVLGQASQVGGPQRVFVEPYIFEVAPKESYWAAMVRLAAEVNWELFWAVDARGQMSLFFDSLQTIVAKYGVLSTINREDAGISDWSYTWDVRQKATTLSLVLIDDMFGPAATLANLSNPQDHLFQAGDLLQLERFGPASTGSSAHPKKFPGRWIIQDRTRNKSDVTTQYTLVQPDLPKQEPAPQVKTGVPAPGTPGTGGPPGHFTGSPNSRGVINPIPGFDNISLDYGIDADAKAGTPIYAPAACSIVASIPDFYSGQSLVLYKFDVPLPQAPTQYFYLSEQVDFVATSGRAFSQGDVIGRFAPSGTGIEIGWGSPANTHNYRYGELRNPGTDHVGVAGDSSANIWGKSFAEYFGIPLDAKYSVALGGFTG